MVAAASLAIGAALFFGGWRHSRRREILTG
jgi:hypothetical protein